MKRYVFFLLLIFVLMAPSAISYTRITSSSGDSPKWSSMPVSFWINQAGSPQIANGSDFEAVLASFHTWEMVPSADIRLNYRGTTSTNRIARDGINLVSFADADDQSLLGSSTIAATFSFFRVQNNTLFFDDADIIFNTSLDFSTSGETGKFDIQSVLTHEIGHFLGLDHSALVSSVMVPFGSPSQIHQRTLAYDDIAGVTEIYPKTTGLPPTGQITGYVRSGSVPVFGANVVAVDQGGTVWLSTLTQPTGQYTLRFLPPGSYKVYAEPLDQPVTEQNVGGGSTSWYRNLKTDFGTTYYGDVGSFAQARSVLVTTGPPTIFADIQVLPKGTTGLNLTRPAFAARVARGANGTLTIGGEDITAGTLFSVSSSDVFLGPPAYGGRISSVASTSAQMSLSVMAGAVTGPRNITVNRGVDSSVASGAIVIVDRQATPQQISPVNGPTDGGTPVVILGSDFRSDAKVYFGGLAATDVAVLDSTTIRATTPRNVPGAANVMVINADGTNGLISRGFTYLPPTPSITSTSPSSGPPSTVVTIDGTQFDTKSQNIEVRFNGTVGRVVSTTATRITAIVPYGATSGPVTVSVFGVPATGTAAFEVTAVSASSNRAVDGYNFIESSSSTGGTTLQFQWASLNDDGLASLRLPFDFTLFGDTYLAGSSIAASSNGWLSLEPFSDAFTYQNGRLPGTSVVDSSGVARAIPPSLIAPFFDDLALVPNVSSVSTRLIGDAPNRQFIVQWTSLTILDEDGRDLNANITFEVVLYEGSNDIQFLYQAAKGTRSDGSSATIGLQNLARDKAVLSSFNQAKVSNGYYLTYRFNQGGYNTAESDTTPPAKPIVTDGGALTSSRTELYASWISQDPESGIREYQYAIGRGPGATDVVPFTKTNQNYVVVTGLSLDAGSTYYFAVRAVNNAGLVSDVGVSDGIRVDPTFSPDIKIIPAAPLSSTEFSGIALYAPVAMSVVLKAFDANGSLSSGSRVQNPVTLSLVPGQQYARLIQELFGMTSFDGWIQIEASATGLGVYTATGSWDMRLMDGTVAPDLSADFVFLHSGASITLVNPTSRTASLTISDVSGSNVRALTIPPLSKFVTVMGNASRVRSSERLSAIERFGGSSKLGILGAIPAESRQLSIVIPAAVTGPGYVSWLSLANITSLSLDATVYFAGFSRVIRFEPNSTIRVPLADWLQIPGDAIRNGAVRVDAGATVFGPRPSIVGALDIETPVELVSISSRPPDTEFLFTQVVQGNGFYTALCIATGAMPATVTVEVYPNGDAAPQSATLTLGANQQVAKQISEIVPAVRTQTGGFIRIHSDQPIWTWEIYGSDRVMAGSPPSASTALLPLRRSPLPSPSQ